MPALVALAADLEAYLHGEPLAVRSGRLASVFNRTFRETPHAVVLENFALLWMLHSAVVLLMCGLTTGLACSEVTNPLWYLLLWGGGLIVWAWIFWRLRKRAGPVLFIERQVAHVWGSAIAATIGVFVVEYLLGMKVLSLAPMLAVIAGITFAVKAGMLSGVFYFSAAAEFLSAIPMARPPLYPNYGILLFGVVTAVCFFLPGLKYYRQRLRKRGRAGGVSPLILRPGENQGADAPRSPELSRRLDSDTQSLAGELFDIQFGSFEIRGQDDGSATVMGLPHLVSRFGAGEARQLHDATDDEHQVIDGALQQDDLEARDRPFLCEVTIIRAELTGQTRPVRTFGVGLAHEWTPSRERRG